MLFSFPYVVNYSERLCFYRLCASNATIITILAGVLSIIFQITDYSMPNTSYPVVATLLDISLVIMLFAIKPLYILIASILLLLRYHLHVFYIVLNSQLISDVGVIVMSIFFVMGVVESAQYTRFIKGKKLCWIASKGTLQYLTIAMIGVALSCISNFSFWKHLLHAMK